MSRTIMIMMMLLVGVRASAEPKPDLKKLLVGKWHKPKVDDVIIEYTADGKASIYTLPKKGKPVAEGTYMWLDAETVEIDVGSSNGPKDREKIAIEGDTLRTTGPDGHVARYLRAK